MPRKPEITTTPARSRLMANVRQSGTSMELVVRKMVTGLGHAYETNAKDLPGSPDLVNRHAMWAIFAHGCFWHAHEPCTRWKIPESNQAFWRRKFSDNRRRDRLKLARLRKLGYSVLVIWGCQLESENRVKKRIKRFLMPYEPTNNMRTDFAKEISEEYRYSQNGKFVLRIVKATNGRRVSRILRRITDSCESARSAFHYALIRKRARFPTPKSLDCVRAADLFCGCGGLSLGAMEAARAIGKRFVPVAAVDNDPVATKVYEQNFPSSKTYTFDISEVLDGTFGSEPTSNESSFLKDVTDVEIALAGPPCQGYSSLNNITRLQDDRNALYERVARFAELVRPEHVLIENVSTVVHGREGAVYQSINEMSELGYAVDSGVVDLAKIGVPQRRKRHVVVASLHKSLSVNEVTEKYRVSSESSVKWAIEDLEDETPNSDFSAPPRLSEENMKRVKYLHENDKYVLPNWLRPDCHRNGHTYPAMYGRMRLNEPAQTVTCGFLSPGQGRFVHPTRLRTIVPHEAARLQFFPDYFDFSLVKSKQSLSRLIGNATPWQLSYVFCLELLAPQAHLDGRLYLSSHN